MDLENTRDGKDICPECMKVRAWDMAKAILLSDLHRMTPDKVKFLYSNLDAVMVRLELKNELRKAENTVVKIE